MVTAVVQDDYEVQEVLAALLEPLDVHLLDGYGVDLDVLFDYTKNR